MREIGLGNISGNDGGGGKTDARQKHFHLFYGGILGFVQNNERFIQGTAAHEGERRHLNHVAFYVFVHPVEAEHFKQSVIQGA